MKEKTQSQRIVGMGAEKAESPERLNDYIRVTSYGGIFVILALVIFAVTLFIWGFYGTLPVTETVTGVVDGSNSNKITCFMDASRFSGKSMMGKTAVTRLTDGTIVSGVIEQVGTAPVSKEEATQMIGNDWLSSNLIKDNYSNLIIIAPDKDLADYSYELAQISVITDEVKPISFLMK